MHLNAFGITHTPSGKLESQCKSQHLPACVCGFEMTCKGTESYGIMRNYVRANAQMEEPSPVQVDESTCHRQAFDFHMWLCLFFTAVLR